MRTIQVSNQVKDMSAGIVSMVYGLRKENVRDAFSLRTSDEHRLEYVLTVRGVKFVNDSRATNVNATWFALEQTVGPIVWIAGGIDRGNDYSSLLGIVKKKVKAIVFIGADNTSIQQAFKENMVTVNMPSMPDAVRLAYAMARPGDTVLLSPACASFDLFENWEDRGRKFKEAVCQL